MIWKQQSGKGKTKLKNRSCFLFKLFIDVNADITNEHIQLLTQVLQVEFDVRDRKGFQIEDMGSGCANLASGVEKWQPLWINKFRFIRRTFRITVDKKKDQ